VSDMAPPLSTMQRRRPTTGRLVGLAVLITLVAAWLVLLRPQVLGGSYSYVVVAGHSMEPRLHTNDLALIRQHSSYRIGDVIAYHVPAGEPGTGTLIIHRIVKGSAAGGYTTRGDNRDSIDPWRPKPHDIVGALTVKVPKAGFAIAAARTPLGLAALAGFFTFLFILGEVNREPRRKEKDAAPRAGTLAP